MDLNMLPPSRPDLQFEWLLSVPFDVDFSNVGQPPGRPVDEPLRVDLRPNPRNQRSHHSFVPSHPSDPHLTLDEQWTQQKDAELDERPTPRYSTSGSEDVFYNDAAVVPPNAQSSRSAAQRRCDAYAQRVSGLSRASAPAAHLDANIGGFGQSGGKDRNFPDYDHRDAFGRHSAHSSGLHKRPHPVDLESALRPCPSAYSAAPSRRTAAQSRLSAAESAGASTSSSISASLRDIRHSIRAAEADFQRKAQKFRAEKAKRDQSEQRRLLMNPNLSGGDRPDRTFVVRPSRVEAAVDKRREGSGERAGGKTVPKTSTPQRRSLSQPPKAKSTEQTNAEAKSLKLSIRRLSAAARHFPTIERPLHSALNLDPIKNVAFEFHELAQRRVKALEMGMKQLRRERCSIPRMQRHTIDERIIRTEDESAQLETVISAFTTELQLRESDDFIARRIAFDRRAADRHSQLLLIEAVIGGALL